MPATARTTRYLRPHARGQDHDREHDNHDQHRGPEVRLLVDEQDRDRSERQHHDEVSWKHRLLATAVHGDHEDQHERCEFRRLDLEGSK